jgi:DNA-binding CsgD family transcriptional regulator
MDAAYSFVRDEEVWLQKVVEVLRPYGLGGGIVAYTNVLGEKIAVRSVVNETPLPSEALKLIVDQLPAPFFRRIHSPMPLAFSLELYPEVAATLGLGGQEIPYMVTAQLPPAAWAIAGGDRDVESALVAFHCEADQAHSPRDRQVLDCFAAHLGSALRLRSMLGARPTGDSAAVEAVFGSDGKLLDARGLAAGVEERATLVDAVRRSERAKLRAATEEERLDVWTALLEGRWSIVENEERDGKRTLLACRNDPRVTSFRTLSDRERAVVSYAVLGHSLKYIAYELGLAISTVSGNLGTAMRKLGVASRAELVRLFAGGAPSAQ